MSINLKVTLGTVNFTDFLHVTAAKVATPNAIAWEDWIPMPVTNYNFIIPNLDPDNYYITYYDAPTNGSLGTLVSQLVVNALTAQYQYERRFYTVNGGGMYDPADGDFDITDPYLVGKNVTGYFKEGFRYLEPVTEFAHDDTNGVTSNLTGNALSQGEKVSLEILYAVGPSNSQTISGFYSGHLDITDATHTLLASDSNKRLRCVGTDPSQAITLCALSSIATGDGFYFDNACGGVATQVKILLPGVDKIRFSGFMLPSSIFTEFWVSQGEHLLLRKHDATYWEVILDYKGVQVGEKVTVGYKAHPNTLTENGQLIDGDLYPRFYWWLENVLPATHKYVVVDIADGVFQMLPNRRGQFAMQAGTKLFRMPLSTNMTEKGLADFETYGGDVANRTIDYPGGYQGQQVGEHDHLMLNGDAPQNNGQNPTNTNHLNRAKNNGNTLAYELSGSNADPIFCLTGKAGGAEQRNNNIGVIYGRRI